NADSVAILAKEFIKQHRKYGVLTSLKHFPGHGSSKEDTHLGMADVTGSWTERELIPYKMLIDSGYADAVMTSHIVNRNLDKKGNPGTLSYDILQGILRDRLNFDGLVFTDDMQMHAITKHYGLEETIKLAINAGVDIMTFSNNISGSAERTVDKVHSIIKKLVESGQIKRERIDESYARIMKVKNQLMNKDQMSAYKKQLEQLEIQATASAKEIDKLNAELNSIKEENERFKSELKGKDQSDMQKKKKKKKR